MQKLEWSQFVLRFPSLSFPLSKLWGQFKAQLLQFISPSVSCSTAFLVLRQGSNIFISFRFLLFSFCGPPERQNPLDNKFSYFFLFFNNNYYYYNYFTPCKFFPPVLSVGLSLESKRQQVFLGFQYFSEYSCRSTLIWSGWSWFFLWFPIRQSPFQALGDCSSRTNYYSYHPHLHVPQHFQPSSKI